jgi:hypothetical protein
MSAMKGNTADDGDKIANIVLLGGSDLNGIEHCEIENNVSAVADDWCIDSLSESGYVIRIFTGL